jgi:hypothetical protein
MRTTHSHPLTVLTLAGSLLAVTGAASADTLVTDFDDFSLTGQYVSWTTANLISGPTSFTVQSAGYGGGFFELDPNIDATGETTIELEVTVNSANPAAGIGVILVLVDEDITQLDYGQAIGDFEGWFGLLPGETYLLTADIETDWFQKSANGANNVLDINDLGHFHIQIDPGVNPDAYDVSFNNLSLTGAVISVPGDADGDGDVDTDDFNIMSSNMYTNVAGGASDGDFDDNGGVDFDDFVIQALNFGDWPAAEEGISTLPEPATAALIGMGVCWLTLCRSPVRRPIPPRYRG